MTAGKLFVACALAAVIATPAIARAESTPSSTITQIKLLETSDSRHKQFHGVVWIDADKASHNYRWGGKYCGDSTLSDASVQLLLAAFRNRYSVSLDYRRVRYQKQTSRCITALTVTRS